MDINDILKSLGIDLTNPDAKRGAIEAIQAILDSRKPLPSAGAGGGGMAPTEKEIDVEIDPDLIQPSQKFNQPANDNDIEIEDEEDILSQVKHNESDDDFDPQVSGSDSSSSDTDSDEGEEADGETVPGEAEKADPIEDEEAIEAEDDTSSGATEPTGNDGEEDGDTVEDGDTELENDVAQAAEDEEALGDEDDSEEAEIKSDEEEPEFDEDDFLDDELKNSYEDQEAKSKHEARRIKRERTLAAAKTALEKAKARNAAPALIRELEKSIEALESLTEAKTKSLTDISDEEFNMMINRVFDAMSAVGDNDLTFTSDEDRALKAKEIKTDLGSRETQQALSDEDIAAIRAETQAVKAREKETAVYRKPAASSFKGFQEFLNSLYRAVALQVQTNEVQDDTWSAINRRYSGTGVLKQGQRKNELPDRKIPIIDFYFDCSGSWGPDDIEVGKKAVSTLVDMEDKGQIKINIYYFSNHVFNDMQSALNEGGTQAWNDIVKNVIATQATNVIIMTDSDMEDWWEGSRVGKPALKYTVPGYVWYLWRDGSNAPRLPRDLKGRGGVQQFSFKRGDV